MTDKICNQHRVNKLTIKVATHYPQIRCSWIAIRMNS